MILSRTDVRKNVSGAKLDAESDFEVRLAIAPPKSINEKMTKKRISKTENNSIFVSRFSDLFGTAKRRSRLKF